MWVLMAEELGNYDQRQVLKGLFSTKELAEEYAEERNYSSCTINLWPVDINPQYRRFDVYMSEQGKMERCSESYSSSLDAALPEATYMWLADKGVKAFLTTVVAADEIGAVKAAEKNFAVAMETDQGKQWSAAQFVTKVTERSEWDRKI